LLSIHKARHTYDGNRQGLPHQRFKIISFICQPSSINILCNLISDMSEYACANGSIWTFYDAEPFAMMPFIFSQKEIQMNKLSFVLLSLCLVASGSLVFAQDSMSMDKGSMDKGSMSKDAMRKDTRDKDAMSNGAMSKKKPIHKKKSMHKDSMTKDSMDTKDTMGKDKGM
ncbi:MAG TPA: hypothetical protein VLS47_01040, partial [Gallionella sp.]|nr:hypothetical protein [Gallionella sp.]